MLLTKYSIKLSNFVPIIKTESEQENGKQESECSERGKEG